MLSTNWLVAVTDGRRMRRAALPRFGLPDDRLASVARCYATRAGLECYEPTYRNAIAWRGRRMWEQGFVLGRYLLFKMSESANELISSVLLVNGIVGILAHDGSPFVVRGVEVDRIKTTEVRGFVARPRFKSGDKLMLTSGAFHRHICTFESDLGVVGGVNLVEVSVSLFGRHNVIRVLRENLEVV